MILPSYKDFAEKNQFFKPSRHYTQNKISTTTEFDKWYSDFSKPYTNYQEKFDFFFRGMKEARHKLYNSAQREWLLHNISEWGNKNDYLQFIRSMIWKAKEQKIFEKVLEYHQINYDNEADFPILSILQHYGAPTPLMDWSYNLDVALYFATEDVNTFNASETIDGYFSIYIIKKSSQDGMLRNIFEYTGGRFPNLGDFQSTKFTPNSSQNFVCYISDFEQIKQNLPTIQSTVPSRKKPIEQRPLTTYYNHNIIPQEGFFVFNPYPDKPLEQCFSAQSRNTASERIGNLNLAPFLCYNIRKDLADYIRRKIKFAGVDNTYIYPELRNFARKVKEEVLNQTIATDANAFTTPTLTGNKPAAKKKNSKKKIIKSKNKKAVKKKSVRKAGYKPSNIKYR
jgi:FRG domain